MAPPEPSVWERRWKSWSPQGSVCRSRQSQNFPDTANTNKVGIVGMCTKCHRGIRRVSFRKVCCKFPKLAVWNQTLYRTLRKRKVMYLHCVSRMNPMRFVNSSVASGVAGTPETRQNPNRSYTVVSCIFTVFHVHTHYVG